MAKEVARDLRAFGSVPFYFIITVRAVIGQYALFLWQLSIAAIGIVMAYRFSDKIDLRLSAGVILFSFTSLFYKDTFYTVFAFIVLLFMAIASAHLKIKRRNMLSGIILGVALSAIAFVIGPLI